MLYPDITYKIRQAVFDVYNNVAGSWSEKTFEEILFDALLARGLAVGRQREFKVMYKENRVGLFRPDLIAEDKIVLELKVVPEISTLHQAQTISYLKVTGLKLGMLINFGGPQLYIKAFPNNVSQKEVLASNFDINKVNLPREDKVLLRPFLEISRNILEILGPGYFHQVYRRAFWDELKMYGIDFEWIKYLELNYQEKIYDRKEVRFFKINNMLISIVAIKALDELAVNQFFKLVKHYKCRQGLIVNFNNTVVDFRFVKAELHGQL